MFSKQISWQAEQMTAEAKRQSVKELTIQHTMTGTLEVTMRRDWVGGLASLVIRIGGTLSAIPSMKNSKQLARVKDKFGGVRMIPMLNPDYLAKLKAMDLLFQKATETELQPVTFGECKVWLTVICGKRRNAFDVDNVFTTIRDWFEPATKSTGAARKERGWGVGLVNNDSQIRGIALKAQDLNIEGQETLIICKPFSDVAQKLTFINDAAEEFCNV